MKKFIKRIILFVIVFIFTGSLAGYIYLLKAYPKISPAQDIKINATPEMLQRGEYLFNNVCGCADCHSTRDYSKYAGPVVQGTIGKGGFEYNEDFGLPGKFYARNITPATLKNWTDGEILRAITEGVSKDGEPLFPLMPYQAFGKMDKQDVLSIIAYLRTLQPIENNIPASNPNFPINLIMRTIPGKNDFQSIPDKSNSKEYGKYLVNVAGCNDCHTPSVKGEYIMEKYLAGGQEFKLPGNIIVRPANITPDIQTGIGGWSKEMFIQKFRIYSKENYNPINVKEGEYNTFMPWTFYAGMTDEDLSAIYDFLKTISPVHNTVRKFEKTK
jgi:hypothetical protein